MAFAAGKHALFISDRSGVAFPYRHMRIEWNGSRVGVSEFEAKQPQLTPPRNIIDPTALKDASPDRVEPAVEILLGSNPFISSSLGSSVITVIQPGHGRSTGDTVRFRKIAAFDGFTSSAMEYSSGYSITKTSNDRYTFDISSSSSSETATVGNKRGGGTSVSAGPVTVSA
jgi:hypothetical protein